MSSISNFIIEFIRLHPNDFTVCCIGIFLVLIILSRPAVLMKIAVFGSIIATGFYILVQQVNQLFAAIQWMIVSSIQQAFEQINRLIK